MEGQKLKSLADGVFKVLHQKDIWKLTQISQPKRGELRQARSLKAHS